MKNFINLQKIICTAFIFVCSISSIIILNTTKKQTSSGIEKIPENEQVSDTEASTNENQINEDLPVITIDAGHGGYDPGKVGADGTNEKDVNLQIALYLRDILAENGFEVYITRTTDISLYEEGAANKKVSDLNQRIAIVTENNSDLFISIHQNSFSASSVHGAQVFYYEGSETGKKLAQSIQDSIRNTVDSTNERAIKGNSEYMILKYSPCTAVIVECGFLSNPDECALLTSSDYQQLMAKAIAYGIILSLE